MLTVLVLLAGALHAADEDLQALRERIREITAELNEVRTSHDAALEELRVEEIKTGELAKQLHDAQNALVGTAAALDDLRGEIALEREVLEERRALLADHLRLTHGLGRQDSLKLLLNVEDVYLLNRNLTYHVLLQRQRLERIHLVRASVARLEVLERENEAKLESLKRLELEKAQTMEALEVQQARREALVASLKERLDSGAEELERLKRDEQQLAELLAGLREELSDIPLPSVQEQTFAELKGELPWPATGPILHRFGTSRPQGNLKWQGVMIASNEGDTVQAISHGRVAFADWLRGFGLLLIVDHGDGFMSLYGGNQSLFKEVGEWVNAGEQIALVGRVEASAQAALYFEIRHNGAPQNPAKWCHGSSLVSG